MSQPEHLVFVTGLSGAGKTFVQGTLEDLGFYCADNLPMPMIELFLDEVAGTEGFSRVGIAIDVRTHRFAEKFPAVYRDEIKKEHPQAVLMFLEATNEVLARRYSETRRPHPIHDRPVLEAIKEERSRLAEVRSEANLVLDTSHFSVHELKSLIMKRFDMSSAQAKMFVTIVTFGFKHGVPYNLDLLFDVRFLPNPHFVEELRPKTGMDGEIRAFLDREPEYESFKARFLDFVGYLVPQYQREMKSYLTIGIGCTGGRHRSVAVGVELARQLESLGYSVDLIHRDCER